MGSGNNLYYPKKNASIGAFRAYFQLNGISAGDLENSVKSFVLNFDDDTTSVIAIENGRLVVEDGTEWYDLSGRRLNGRPLKSGMYIHNGKATVIK